MMYTTQRTRPNKGFTLIELIIVIAIVIVLVALLAFAIFKVLGNTKKSATQERMRNVAESIKKLDGTWIRLMTPKTNSSSYSDEMLKVIGGASDWKAMSEENRAIFLAFVCGPGADSWAKAYRQNQPYNPPLDESATKQMLMSYSGFSAYRDGWDNSNPISYWINTRAGGESAPLVLFSAGPDNIYYNDDDIWYDMSSGQMGEGSVRKHLGGE